MSLVSNWMHVDLFTVDQAAALWAGFDPAGLYSTDSLKPSEVLAAKQMIVSSIVSGEMVADSRANYFAGIGDHSASLVSRANLEKFARKRGLFPAFLFDTLARFEGTGGMGGSTSHRTAPTFPPELQAPSAAANRGGRPAEHDWDAFILEIIRRANQPDGLPETQAELVRQMLAWFLQVSGREPAESAVKDRISKIYRYLNEAKNPDG